ncbi:hypothetical protein BDV98DRAFT_567575 [Pterulicium gracile]|uniref:C2H2-type domain-containing protein n=1 Tax=Pterulicium gracile TaxID=1884261 RepID=A0A5C3QIR2_9AGAR|nr:hypothetical protein BDV98DRAFT_567575 [Pterula gracilis]
MSDFACPYCDFVQHSRRAPDFRRHLRTHMRSAADKGGEGHACHGGCRKTFARPDALKRHLNNPNVACVRV